jgi:hypothetical protein
MRTPLLIIALLLALACEAFCLHARAAEVPSAETSAARAFMLYPPPPAPAPTRAIDEYGNIRWEDEQARLDNFAIEVQYDPTVKGHITCYGGRIGRAGEARRRCERAKSYLIGYRHIPAKRIITVDGGYREDLTVVLWVVPPGVKPPQPVPTVDPRDVRFIKPKPKGKGRRS